MTTTLQESVIRDTRHPNEFKSAVFSGNTISYAKETLVESMLRDKVEPAFTSSADLLCAGHFSELWDVIISFMSKHIHLGNPKLPLLLANRFETFRMIITDKELLKDIDARNNETIRHLFAEIICVLSLSTKKNSFEYIKIDREEEFDMTKNRDRFKATSSEFAKKVMRDKDPRELVPAINEFLYHLSINHNKSAVYWTDWIIEFDALCRNRKEPIWIDPRTDYPIENRFRKDAIWLVWESIQFHAQEYHNELIQNAVRCLFELFCIRYTSASSKKRRYTIYFAIALLSEPVDCSIGLFASDENRNRCKVYCAQIHKIYKDLKKGEILRSDAMPLTEKEKNFKDSVQKIKLLEELTG
jgi:hypothetical protein